MLLAIDLSTNIASAAALRGREILVERIWTETRERTQLFDMIPAIIESAEMGLDAVDGYVVGLGPGSYMGLRISLSAAMALALPDHKPVYGINSAEPLALSIMSEFSCGCVVVAGDARRGHFWLRRFNTGAESGEPGNKALAWHLVKPEEIRQICPPGAVCVTSDWDKIGRVLEHSLPDSVVIIKERRTPSAASLGRLATDRIELGAAFEPLAPIYLNPAVASQ